MFYVLMLNHLDGFGLRCDLLNLIFFCGFHFWQDEPKIESSIRRHVSNDKNGMEEKKTHQHEKWPIFNHNFLPRRRLSMPFYAFLWAIVLMPRGFSRIEAACKFGNFSEICELFFVWIICQFDFFHRKFVSRVALRFMRCETFLRIYRCVRGGICSVSWHSN